MPLLTHADLKLNYQLIGPAPTPETPPVSLIHGLGANMAFWYLGALRHLGRDQTILLHDLRGHGASSMPLRGYGLDEMAEDFRLLLDELGIERTHVVGHSHGARVALAFALLHPDRVESLTLADTQIRALQEPMTLGDWPHWPEWKADLATRGVTQFPPEDSVIDFKLLAELGPRSAGGRGGRSLVDAPPAGAKGRLRKQAGEASGSERGPPRRREAGTALSSGPLAGGARRIDLQSRQMGARGAERWQALMDTTEAPTEMQDETAIHVTDLPKLTMPVLLIYGKLSHCVPTAEALAERLPNARLMLVPGAGHFFPIVKPRAFARALNVFLARANGAPAWTAKTARPTGQRRFPEITLPTQPGGRSGPYISPARRLMPGLAARAAQLVRRVR